MSRVYDTQALLNRTYLTREHHADFRTAEVISGWVAYLAHLHRQGHALPLPPDARFHPDPRADDVDGGP